MKYIDLLGQSIFIATPAVIILQDPHAAKIAIIAFQGLLGLWQYTSSSLSVFHKLELYHHKKRHLTYATIYMVVFILLVLLMSWVFTDVMTDVHPGVIWAFLCVVPWTLALYYYYITWCWVLNRKTHRGSFLPNLNF